MSILSSLSDRSSPLTKILRRAGAALYIAWLVFFGWLAFTTIRDTVLAAQWDIAFILIPGAFIAFVAMLSILGDILETLIYGDPL